MGRLCNIMLIVLTVTVTQFIYCYVNKPSLPLKEMCISPIPIKNPYRRSELQIINNHTHNILSSLRDDFVLSLHDSHSTYMLVPCGHCKDCLRARRYNLVQRCEMESLNCYPFFITLTYNNEHLPHYTAGNGKTYRFADREHVKKMFKRFRTNNSIPRPFRYIAVSERGALRSRPHHHILLFLPRYKDDDVFTPYQLEELLYNLFRIEWRVNISEDTFKPKYEPLYTYRRVIRNGSINCTFDCHYVRPTIDDVSRNVTQYIFKYIAKPSKVEHAIFKELKETSPDFTHDWRVIRSCFTASRFWGCQTEDIKHPSDAVLKHIRMCVQNYNSGFPQYFSPFSEDTCGLAPYYLEKPIFFNENDLLRYKAFLRAHGYYKYKDDCVHDSDPKNPYNIDNDLLQWNNLLLHSDFDKIDFDML